MQQVASLEKKVLSLYLNNAGIPNYPTLRQLPPTISNFPKAYVGNSQKKSKIFFFFFFWH